MQQEDFPCTTQAKETWESRKKVGFTPGYFLVLSRAREGRVPQQPLGAFPALRGPSSRPHTSARVLLSALFAESECICASDHAPPGFEPWFKQELNKLGPRLFLSVSQFVYPHL